MKTIISTEPSESARRSEPLELLIKEAREASRRRRFGWITFFFVVALVATVIASLTVTSSKPSPQIGNGNNDATGRQLTTTARNLCHDILGAQALNSDPVKVSTVRQFTYGPTDIQPAPDAFQGLGKNHVVGLCWTGGPSTSYQLYAVASHYKPVRIEGVSGVGFTSTPPPGFMDFP